MSDTHATPNYGVYWKAWLVLLVLTLVMVFLANPTLLIIGMALKAGIITLWFMHLRYERFDFVLYVTIAMLGCALILFGLIAPDGIAM